MAGKDGNGTDPEGFDESGDLESEELVRVSAPNLKPSRHATIAALVVGLSLVGGCGCRDEKRGGGGTYGTTTGTRDTDTGQVIASGFLGVDRARESRVPGRRVRRGAPLQLA